MKMKTKKMTIREIRKELFDNGYNVTINTVEMTNKQARDFFYMFDNQEKVLETVVLSINNNIVTIRIKE